MSLPAPECHEISKSNMPFIAMWCPGIIVTIHAVTLFFLPVVLRATPTPSAQPPEPIVPSVEQQEQASVVMVLKAVSLEQVRTQPGGSHNSYTYMCVGCYT